MYRKTVLFSLAFVSFIAGCGGGGNEGNVSITPTGFSLASGVAQKGPLVRGSFININEISATNLQPTGKSYNLEVADDYGTFNPTGIVFTSPLIESTALGYYFNEQTGVISNDIAILRSLNNLSVDKAVNVNLLTDISNARIRALVTRPTNPLTFANARLIAQREVLRSFYIYNSADLLPGGSIEPASFGELDLSKNRSADQILAAISAVTVRVGQNGGGISRFLNQLEADIADDGGANNSLSFDRAPSTQFNTAAKLVDWNAVATNLNAYYKTTRYTASDLKQWIDTSGTAERIINRYRYIAVNVPKNTENVFQEYIAGTDDALQCFGVTAGQLYVNGIAISGTVKVSKGSALQVGLSHGESGSGVFAFLQRTSLPSSGVCPTTLPVTGQTRVAKYDLQTKFAPVSAIALGASTSSVVTTEGTLWAWGSNASGQIGDGTHANSLTPKMIGSGFSDVVMGPTHTLALKFDGSLWAWGNNGSGQLGDGLQISSLTPKQIGTGFVKVAAGNLHSIAIKADGTLWAWGANNAGQLGDGTMNPSSVPKQIGSGFVAISAGNYFSVGIKGDGTLWSWGTNYIGQLGDGTVALSTVPKQVGSGFVSISAGAMHVAAIKGDGSLWTWGSNNFGQLGDGSTTASMVPKNIGTGFVLVSAGQNQTHAIKSDGGLWAWGANNLQQLGDGANANSLVPKSIGVGYSRVVSGNGSVLAMKADGSLWGWGTNGAGQYGDGTTFPSSTPKLLIPQ